MLTWEGEKKRPNYAHWDTTSVLKKYNYQALNQEKTLEKNALNFSDSYIVSLNARIMNDFNFLLHNTNFFIFNIYINKR